MNPKFQNYIKKTSNIQSMQENPSRYGIVQIYDPITNTATVVLPDQDSDELGEVLKNVPCPVTLGFKMADPEPGRPCWVTFRRGGSNSRAVITHFFHHNFAAQDAPRKSNIRTGVPRFMNRM